MNWTEMQGLDGKARADAINEASRREAAAMVQRLMGSGVPGHMAREVAASTRAGYFGFAIGELCSEIADLKAAAAKQPADIRAALQAHQAQMKPETGADFILVEFGGTSVLVEYELDDDDAELCGSLADSIRLLGLLVNGQWTDIDDTAANTRDRWVKAIVSKIEAENDRAKADLYISAGVV